MKRSELAKKGLALVLTAAMCAQPLMVSAEEFSFQSEMEDAVVTEAEPELVEESGEAEGFEDADGFLSDDSLDEADGMTGDAEGEAEEDEADSETDEFVASMDENAVGLDIDESAATVMEGNVENAEGLTWRVDVNGVLYLEGEGELPDTYLTYLSDGSRIDPGAYSITSLVIGSRVSGSLYGYYLGSIYSNMQNIIIKDRINGAQLKDIFFGSNYTNLQKVIIGTGVLAIYYDAFYNCTSLKEVIISDGVETIGQGAFAGCTSLEEVIIPESVETIGQSAFASCTSLEEVIIPESVETIGQSAFSGCTSLEEVVIPDSVKTYEMDNWNDGDTFYNCTSLKKVVLSKNAKVIPDGMFRNCTSLVDVTIPDGITTIVDGAFRDVSSEANLLYPDSVTSIGYWYDMPECKVTMPCRFAFKGELYKREGYSFYHMNGENDLDDDNCTVCRRTGRCGSDSTYIMTLSGKVTISGTGTVSEFNSSDEDVTSVIIEDGIYYVNTFSYCKNLESVKIADSVKKITAFSNCESLKTITIGKGLENDFAFENCPKLENVIISNENPNYTSKNGVIYSKDGTRLVYYPANLQGDEFVIPAGVTQVSTNAFYYNQNLKKIIVPETVQAIGGYGNSEIKFQYCKNLENIVLNNTVNNVPSDFCYNSESLSEIVIPEGAEYISNEAFRYCKNLKTITLPASVKKIYSEAFDGCSSLTTVHYLGTADQWKAIEIDEKNEFLTDANIHYCTLIKDNAGTCDNAGTRDYSCATCGTTFTVNVPKTEHNYSEWEVTRKATCSQEGEETSICSKCGDTKHRSIVKVKPLAFH